MFDEQIGWIVDAGMDFVIAETFSWGEEALLALDAIKQAGLDRGGHAGDPPRPRDARGVEPGGGLRAARRRRRRRRRAQLHPRPAHDAAAAGADPRASVNCHVAALPVPYRTTDEEPSFQSLTDPDCDCLPDDRPFPTALEPLSCNRYEIAEFGREAYELGIRYLGVCCGAAPHMIRSLAEALGRETPASRYSPDMSRHAFLGTDAQLRSHNLQYAKRAVTGGDERLAHARRAAAADRRARGRDSQPRARSRRARRVPDRDVRRAARRGPARADRAGRIRRRRAVVGGALPALLRAARDAGPDRQRHRPAAPGPLARARDRLAGLSSDEQRRRLLPEIVAAGKLLASVGSEAKPSGKLADIARTELEETAGGAYRLTCQKYFASLASAADELMIWTAVPGAGPYAERSIIALVPSTTRPRWR